MWSDFILYEYQGRWSVKEAEVEREFRGMREDLDKFALGCYFGEVTQALALEGLPSPELLSLILNGLHALDRLERPLALVKGAFELRAMCLAGYEPVLDACAVCGCQPEEPPVPPAGGGAPLRRLPQRGGGWGVHAAGQGALAAMRHVAYGDPKRLFSFQLEEKSLSVFADVAEAYLLTQLERGFSSRISINPCA